MLPNSCRSMVFSALVLTQTVCFVGCKTTSSSLETSAQPKDVSSIESSNSISGRYFGFIKVSSTRKISTVFDLIEVPEAASGSARMRGIMRFFSGDFMSDEFTTMYFQDVSFDSLAGTISASGVDDRFKIESATFSGGMIDGVFSFAKAGVAGEFRLRRQRSIDEGTMEALAIFPDVAAAQRFTGNYYGKCEEKEMTLQVEAARWSGSYGLNGILDGLRVAGRFGLFDKYLCGSSDKSCIHAHFRSGDLNFITGAINLRGYPINKSCVQEGSELVCDSCKLSPTADFLTDDLNPPQDFQVFKRGFSIPSPNSLPASGHKAADTEGQYFGYLHHETQDRYQVFGLNVLSSKIENINAAAPIDENAEISAVASIYFGDAKSPEFVAHRFEPSTFHSGRKMVFDGPGGGFLIADDFKPGWIRGIWYSKTSGRVGTVELTRGDIPELPAGSLGFQKLSGVYEGDQWQFELSVSASVSDSPRDYYPLRVFGWAKEKIPTARRRMIEDGSFDFYSNSLAFRLDDGRMAVGRMNQTGVELFWPPISNVGTPMERQGVKSYVAPKSAPATVSSSNTPEVENRGVDIRSNSL